MDDGDTARYTGILLQERREVQDEAGKVEGAHVQIAQTWPQDGEAAVTALKGCLQ